MGRKSTRDLMQMLDLNEAIDQLERAHCVRWYVGAHPECEVKILKNPVTPPSNCAAVGKLAYRFISQKCGYDAIRWNLLVTGKIALSN